MKATLLEICQEILSDMDSDEVNSISDTIESEQVATIVRSTFFSMMANRDWPHLKKAIQINPFSDTTYPTHMKVQDSIKRLIFLNYNCAKVGESRKFYQEMKWREPEDFLKLTNAQNTDQNVVDIIIDPSGIELMIRNDRNPTYFTSFDDEVLVFNAYNKELEDTLQNSKVQAQAYVTPGWSHTDTHVPDLPEEAFPALVEEAKSRCMFRLKQMEDVKAEQESRRQQRWLAQNSWRVKGGIRYPNYGRGTAKYRRDPTFERND